MHHRLVATGVAAVTTFSVGAVGLAYADAQSAPRHAATAATASSGIHFRITYGPKEREVGVVHGAFTGGGRSVSHGQKDVISLGGGTITVKHPDSKSHFTSSGFNTATCFVSFKITGTYTLGNGTGKYAGWTGHGNYTVHGQAIASRTSTGACDQTGNPRVEAVYITGSGPAHKG